MAVNIYSLSIMFSILFLLTVIELVRKNKLQERYSLLWIFISIVFLVLSSTSGLLNHLAKILDIKNPPSLLFLLGLIYLIVYSLNTTVVVSKQNERITRLTQELSLLKQKMSNNK
ncbi:MAG TPA: DUF2304 domain-containing protein [Acetivibrio sp.]|nr:DUF2304 domain-containing protein [Acetivibrio sp.]